MRPMLALVALCLFTSSLAEDTTTNVYNDNLNSIETKPSVRLDPYIRKALLKALSELEESDNGTTDSDSTDGTTAYEADTFTTTNNFPETRTDKEGIQIHSFIVNGQSAFANNTNTPTIVDNNISILSTTAGNVENQVTATLPTATPLSDIFVPRDGAVNIQQTRSIHSSSKSSIENSIVPLKIDFKPQPITSLNTTTTTTSTTTTTTTTTTPKPTHNDDGENIEEVDKRDVQVFQAPLVAAFTVQQDALGLPKKVIPIYQQTNVQSNALRHPQQIQTSNLGSGAIPIAPNGQIISSVSQQIPQNDFINPQLILQKQLEEKQRILEEQLRLLQLQQRQQEELLRKQQFIFQQNGLAQRQQFLAPKFQAQSSVNNFQVQKNIPQNSFVNQNVPYRSNSAQVSILPSVNLEPNSAVTNQQLPNREAVDFLIHLHNQQQGQFPLQENHLPQGISQYLQPNSNTNYQQGINFNQIRSIDQFGQQKQNNRVFRQDSGVGNFGLNHQNYNAINTFSPIQSNRFITNQNHQNADAELKQLLAQNGLNGRNPDDINIVSKVLSLNHGLPFNNHISNNRAPFDSRRHLRPILF